MSGKNALCILKPISPTESLIRNKLLYLWNGRGVSSVLRHISFFQFTFCWIDTLIRHTWKMHQEESLVNCCDFALPWAKCILVWNRECILRICAGDHVWLKGKTWERREVTTWGVWLSLCTYAREHLLHLLRKAWMKCTQIIIASTI